MRRLSNANEAVDSILSYLAARAGLPTVEFTVRVGAVLVGETLHHLSALRGSATRLGKAVEEVEVAKPAPHRRVQSSRKATSRGKTSQGKIDTTPHFRGKTVTSPQLQPAEKMRLARAGKLVNRKGGAITSKALIAMRGFAAAGRVARATAKAA